MFLPFRVRNSGPLKLSLGNPSGSITKKEEESSGMHTFKYLTRLSMRIR